METKTTIGGPSGTGHTSRWRSRLARVTTATVGVLTVAGTVLAGTGPGASAAPDDRTRPGQPDRCRQAELLINGGFEEPVVTANGGQWELFPNLFTAGLGWYSIDGYVELWRMGGHHSGRQHAEINAITERNTIWQPFPTVPQTAVHWSVALRARNVTNGVDQDTTQVRINGSIVRTVQVDDTRWRVFRGRYDIPRGQWLSTFELQSMRHAGPGAGGNHADSASVRGQRCGAE